MHKGLSVFLLYYCHAKFRITTSQLYESMITKLRVIPAYGVLKNVMVNHCVAYFCKNIIFKKAADLNLNSLQELL